MNSNEIKKYFNMLQDLKDSINAIISSHDLNSNHISTVNGNRILPVKDVEFLRSYVIRCNDLQVFLAEM